MAAKEKTGNAFVETIKTIVYALLIAGVFRTLFSSLSGSLRGR